MTVAQTERLSKLDLLDKEMEKKFGNGVIVKVTDAKLPRWNVSSPTLSYLMGGGLPKGRVWEIYGPESSGKTTLCTQICADVQASGGFVVWIDAENAFDMTFAKKFGVNSSHDYFKLLVPDCGEDALELAIQYAATGAVDLIIIDSVAALVPKAELEGEMTDNQMGAQARMMGKGLRKLTAIAGKNMVSVGFINQLRMKIGVMFGNPETTPGGNALKFYSSMRFEVRKGEVLLDDNEDVIGIVSKIKNVKNKTSTPYKKGELEIFLKTGLDSYKEYFNFAVKYQIVDKSGAWFSYRGMKLGQGADKASNELRGNPELFEEVKKQVNVFLLNEDPLEETSTNIDVEESPDFVEDDSPLFEPVDGTEDLTVAPLSENEIPKKRGRPKKG